MSLIGLLNQVITVYTRSGYDKTGRIVDDVGTDYPARVQETTKQRMLPNSTLITIDLIAYVSSTVSINNDVRVDYNGTKYKVTGKYSAVGGDGRVDHYKLELVKWRQT